LILSILSLLYLIFNLFKESKSQFVKEESPYSSESINQCPFPEEQGINLCCYNDNKLELCNDKEFLKCGDNIRIMLKIDGSNVKNPFIMCLKENFDLTIPVNDNSIWTIVDNDSIFTCWTDDNSGEDILAPLNNPDVNIMLNGVIKEQIESEKILEVYAFPVKDYQSIQDLMADKDNAEVIFNLDKEIICE
jgi:hypothetical protein